MFRLVLYFSLWIGSMGVAIFASQNIDLVSIKFGSFESIRIPLGLVLIFCAGVGATLITSITLLSQQTIKFTLPDINQKAKSNPKVPFFKQQSKPQSNSTKSEFTKKKSQYKDDFDDDWDDDWG